MRLKWFFVALVGYSWLFKSLHAAPPSDNVLDLEPAGVLHVGKQPKQIGVAPNGKKAYVTSKIVYASNTGSATIAAIDAKTGRILRRIRVGAWPKTIDVTRDGRWLFSANYAGRSLSIVDLQHGRESTRLPMPDRLSGLALSPNNQHLYATGWDTGRVWRWRLVLPKK